MNWNPELTNIDTKFRKW